MLPLERCRRSVSVSVSVAGASRRKGKSKTVSDIRMPPGNFSLLARARDHLGAEVRELQQGRNLPWVVNVVSKG